ncbi:hypothetical protein IWX90DRAFT_90914 [Phyllosticta citrichinensis]|uniref:Uncharacterized protein n=1 Tax=Phyllosticta citrichinensis TaxID=1130410 RepID=A0ABR1XFD6_9PEZI
METHLLLPAQGKRHGLNSRPQSVHSSLPTPFVDYPCIFKHDLGRQSTPAYFSGDHGTAVKLERCCPDSFALRLLVCSCRLSLQRRKTDSVQIWRLLLRASPFQTLDFPCSLSGCAAVTYSPRMTRRRTRSCQKRSPPKASPTPTPTTSTWDSGTQLDPRSGLCRRGRPWHPVHLQARTLETPPCLGRPLPHFPQVDLAKREPGPARRAAKTGRKAVPTNPSSLVFHMVCGPQLVKGAFHG